MGNTDKKILIISHDPLSYVNNNGKTLASIFEGVPQENIYQIYLKSDISDYSNNCHYLQINEKQIIKSIIKRKNLCCIEVESNPKKVPAASIKRYNFANHTKRLLRECVWKFGFWKSKLSDWLSDKQFDVVFFMAGDGMFAYEVYRFVMQNISAKGCLFFTDDYIIGKSSNSPIALLRRFLLKRKIRLTLKSVKELYVISDEMKSAYYKLFGKESYVIRNFSVEKQTQSVSGQDGITSDNLTMVYAGGLHYNRWKVLVEIATVLKDINQHNSCKCFLKIYSSQKISDDIIEKMSIEGGSKFCGSASASQIADIYADADILLHVESFDKKAVASTMYSFSTKIPEYLSAGKCVLAVGPSKVASFKYLEKFACVINETANLSPILQKIISDNEYRNLIKSNCKEHYEKDFSKKKQLECLERILAD